jgi:hypothetical protein
MWRDSNRAGEASGRQSAIHLPPSTFHRMIHELPPAIRTHSIDFMRLALALCAAALAAVPAGAQLRPLDPFDWRALTGPAAVRAEIGGSRLSGQRASLAGTEGTLTELGSFRAFFRTGRVVIEAGGTVQRLFRDERRFAPAEPEVAEEGPDRNDSGDYRIATVVRLTPERWGPIGILRFGTRLPTTDNTVGLDRDAIDFFALLGGYLERGGASLSAETGITINTTRQVDFEQDDLLVYILRAEYDLLPVVPSLTLTGQQIGTGHSEIRGNESLSELRLGARAGERLWARAEYVVGLADASPSGGVVLTAGWAP